MRFTSIHFPNIVSRRADVNAQFGLMEVTRATQLHPCSQLVGHGPFLRMLNLNMVAKDKDTSVTVQGKVFLIDTNSSIIMVDTKTGVRRLVAYSPETKFRYGRNDKGQESSIHQVQETQYISCSGKSDDGARLVAKEVCAPRAEIVRTRGITQSPETPTAFEPRRRSCFLITTLNHKSAHGHAE